MTIFTDAQAKQQLEAVLDQAEAEGEVVIKRADGTEFLVRPASVARSPLDVSSVKTSLTADDIVRAVRESRER